MINYGKRKDYFKKRRWYDAATGKQFVGYHRENGLLYYYSKDGQKKLLTKPKPNLDEFIKNLWMFENPQHLGLVDGYYFPYMTANGNTDIGPGIDMEKQPEDFKQRAYKGLTEEKMDEEVRRRAQFQFDKVDEGLGLHTSYTDTISPQMKEGLADTRWQTGPLETNFPNLLDAVAHGNLDAIREESKVYFTNKQGKKQFDKRRYDERNKAYFNYDKPKAKPKPLTGPVRPKPVDFSRPLFNLSTPILPWPSLFQMPPRRN